ncbi:hypothetical protein D9M71_525480 [compost metagenome]
MHRFALQVQAIETHIDDEADQAEQRRQGIGLHIQQAKAGHPEQGGVGQRDFQRDLALDHRTVLGALHLDVDVTVDAVVEHATGRHHQRSANHRGQEQHEVDMPLRGKEETACHRKHVTENDPRFGDLDKVLNGHVVLPHFAIMLVWMLNMIHSDRPTNSAMTITVNRKVETLELCSLERSMCRKYTRCTTT